MVSIEYVSRRELFGQMMCTFLKAFNIYWARCSTELLQLFSEPEVCELWSMGQIWPTGYIYKWSFIATHSGPFVYGCIFATTAELNSCDRDHITHKAENIYYLVLDKKVFLAYLIKRYSIFKQVRFHFCTKTSSCLIWHISQHRP